MFVTPDCLKPRLSASRTPATLNETAVLSSKQSQGWVSRLLGTSARRDANKLRSHAVPALRPKAKDDEIVLERMEGRIAAQ